MDITNTVPATKVWRCAGTSGSGFAVRSDVVEGSFVEVFAANLDYVKTEGATLYRIV